MKVLVISSASDKFAKEVWRGDDGEMSHAPFAPFVGYHTPASVCCVPAMCTVAIFLARFRKAGKTHDESLLLLPLGWCGKVFISRRQLFKCARECR